MATITPIPYQEDSEVYFSRLAHLPFACWLDSGKPKSNYGRYDIISALPAVRLITESPLTEIIELRYSFNSDQPVTSHLHSHLDSRDLHVRNLLQTLRPDGETDMNDNLLLIIGMLAFGLTVVGLILTVREFKKFDQKP